MVARFNFLECKEMLMPMPYSLELMGMDGNLYCQPCWSMAAAYAANQTRYPFDLIKCCTRQNKLQFNCRDKISKRLGGGLHSLQYSRSSL